MMIAFIVTVFTVVAPHLVAVDVTLPRDIVQPAYNNPQTTLRVEYLQHTDTLQLTINPQEVTVDRLVVR